MAISRASRNSMLAKIHIAKKDLGMDDDTYRLMLANLFSVSSARDLSGRDLDALLGHLTERGFTARKRGDKAAPPESAKLRKPLIAKIGALLTVLGQMEGRHVPWDYAVGILKRQSGVMRLEWGTPEQLRGVVAALGKRIQKFEQAALTGEVR